MIPSQKAGSIGAAILAALLFSATANAAVTTAEAAESREWRILLHFRKAALGPTASEITDGQFFLSPQGRRSPAAELEATIHAFQTKPETQCDFPARRRFLREKMQLTFAAPKNSTACAQFDDWRKIFVPESASL